MGEFRYGEREDLRDVHDAALPGTLSGHAQLDRNDGRARRRGIAEHAWKLAEPAGLPTTTRV